MLGHKQLATAGRTSDGGLLDTLRYQHYGHLNGTIEAVLAANRLLADELQPLRTGLLITFRDKDAGGGGDAIVGLI
ncbi:tail protein X [Pseudomonas sp. 10B1]|uniref:tail protein X n=1 Tax=unclassified Pseudomonas TaxID=196821 RepID=UPI002AB506F6|nr:MULTISPECIES: tail protein X [unclassified Pseudomonas]MDY7561240.1 tail protein X [Pseudomonas sp. AB6]MEA9976982.1 tail protein X [Pseudomonas sp. RTS4]MEA9995949.1 tail protein X [Pseudomonas sp. AA4]MEB0087669.1 tail protein X [Pseudomonas sp. RTI1]MEB0127750.1 tail protein X [Pseudomonas sp. CCC1.2]